MLNIGANKGYNLAEWMQRYTPADVSNKKWHQLMMRKAEPPCALQCCGVCLVCHRKRMKQVASSTLHLHAFELQPSNERLLRQLVRLTGAPVEVHAAAVSNASGVVYTRDSGSPGYESVSAMRAPRGRGGRLIQRNVTTVDAFLAARKIDRVALVSIDTEGWDAFVMYGMAKALRRKVVDAVEFEYTRAWKPHLGEHALAEHLRWLDSVGYTCFWQGNRGALAQANMGCWHDEYHARISHRWSNLVCTARADLLAAFRTTTTA
jgi:FkbM family methyltransferase